MAATMETDHMLTDTAQLMLLTEARMVTRAAATLGAAGFGMAMAIACGGGSAFATSQTFNQHKRAARACQYGGPILFTALRTLLPPISLLSEAQCYWHLADMPLALTNVPFRR